MTSDSVHSDEMFDDDPTLAAFARDLRYAADAAPLPVVGVALADVFAGNGVPPVTTSLPPVPRPRRSARLRVLVGSAVFGVAVGSLGVAGALPGPVQRQVSRVGRVVGVDLPTSTHDEPAPTTSTTTTTVVPGAGRPRPSTTEVIDDDHDGVEGEDQGDEPDAPGVGDERRSDEGEEHGRDGNEGRGSGEDPPDGDKGASGTNGARDHAAGVTRSGQKKTTTTRN